MGAGSAMARIIKVKCYRSAESGEGYDAADGFFQEYEVPVDAETSVQDLLMYISDNLDPTLAFFKHAACKQGLCGRCILRVNGKACLACTTPVPPHIDTLTIEPISNERIIRDLMCVLEASR